MKIKYYTPTGKFKKGYYHFETGMGYRFFYPIRKRPTKEQIREINLCSCYLEKITEEPKNATYVHSRK